MDMARSEVRKLAADDYTTGKHLEHAAQQARERNYQDFLIVDVDAHHYESESYKEVFDYIESPVIRHQAMESAKRGARASDARRHGRLSGHRRPHHPPRAAPARHQPAREGRRQQHRDIA